MDYTEGMLVPVMMDSAERVVVSDVVGSAARVVVPVAGSSAVGRGVVLAEVGSVEEVPLLWQ